MRIRFFFVFLKLGLDCFVLGNEDKVCPRITMFVCYTLFRASTKPVLKIFVELGWSFVCSS